MDTTPATSPGSSPASPTASVSSSTSTCGPPYPGWGFELQRPQCFDEDQKFMYPIGITNEAEQSMVEKITVREADMMRVMEALTDKPDWHIKVFNDEIANRWRREITEWDHLDDKCADYCIAELRHKAQYFEKSGITLTFVCDFGIAKSDRLVPAELSTALRDAFSRLAASESRPDWHPRTDETVRDLVHPSMYPLVFGRSLCIPDELVGVDDAIDRWAGKGEVIPRRPEWGNEPQGDKGKWMKIEKVYWSTTYQWLPANIGFTPDGGVRFTSYINNLHPTKHRDVYTVLERLVEVAIPMWDHCLTRSSSEGRESGPWSRERVTVPQDCGRKEDDWYPKSALEMLRLEKAEEAAKAAQLKAEEAAKSPEPAETAARGEEAAEQPSPPEQTATDGVDVLTDHMDEGEKLDEAKDDEETDDDEEERLVWDSDGSESEGEREDRWRQDRRAVLPPPNEFTPTSYKPDEDSTLRALFHDRGLQVIVKLASIELTPDKPRFDGGGWHVEGQMNERIVGTCLYYLDSENITEASLAFRAQTRYGDYDYEGYDDDQVSWMEQAYGVRLRGGARLQEYGSVKTPQGRLLAFPNIYHHRVSPFELADPTKPGHRRFVALWLVEPDTRIISTANVPPQQAEWYAECAFGKSATAADDLAARLPRELVQMIAERGIGPAELADALAVGKAGEARLPPELLEMVRRALGEWRLMTREEAEGHREKLMDERSVFVDTSDRNWRFTEYGFCEH